VASPDVSDTTNVPVRTPQITERFLGFLHGHPGPVRNAIFSSAGKYIASCGRDNIRLWTSVKEDGEKGWFGKKEDERGLIRRGSKPEWDWFGISGDKDEAMIGEGDSKSTMYRLGRVVNCGSEVLSVVWEANAERFLACGTGKIFIYFYDNICFSISFPSKQYLNSLQIKVL
jgi:WD40 repeat protein